MFDGTTFQEPPHVAARGAVEAAPDKSHVRALVRAQATECAEAAQGDLERAADLLLQRAPTWGADFTRDILREWAKTQIRMSGWMARSEIVSSLSRPHPEDMPAERAHNSSAIAALARHMLDWPLERGIMLRTAKRPEVMKAAEKYLGDAKVYAARGKWLKAIAEALPDDDMPVGAAIDEERALKMARKFNVIA